MAAAQDADFSLNASDAFFLETDLINIIGVIGCRNTDDLQYFLISSDRSFEDGLEATETNFMKATKLRENWS